MDKAKDNGMEFSINHIPREDNVEADKLANMGMDRMENKVEIDWQNVNAVMR